MLSSIVCSFENSLKLKEIGFINKSIFYWSYDESNFDCSKFVVLNNNFGRNSCPAYTAQELLDKIENLSFVIGKNDDELYLYFHSGILVNNSYRFTKGNLASLIAQMLIAQWQESKVIT